MKVRLPSPGGRKSAAFTLMELLIVIAIIAILAALLLSTAGMVQDKAARTRAEAEIQSLSTGLESYKLDFGSYPEQADDPGSTSTKVILEELAINPIDHPEKYSKRKPFEFQIKTLSAYVSGQQNDYDTVLRGSDSLVDPWGNPYYYQSPGNDKRNGDQFFDLFSKGKKASADENLWIKNW